MLKMKQLFLAVPDRQHTNTITAPIRFTADLKRKEITGK